MDRPKTTLAENITYKVYWMYNEYQIFITKLK